MQKIIIEDYKDISDPNFENILFKIKWIIKEDRHGIELEVYDSKDWSNERIHDKDANEWIENTDDVYFSMMIKWDGCAHCNFHYIHFCGITDVTRFCLLLNYIYKRAAELVKLDTDKNLALTDNIKVEICKEYEI